MHRHRDLSVEKVSYCVITVSDSRTPETDESGKLIVEALKRAGHELHGYRLVPDDTREIRLALEEMLGKSEVDVVILNGGTGISARDVTPEAVKPLLDKELPGFGEAFRALGFGEIGPWALLSRAFASVARGKLVFALPGSPHGVSLALEKLILPVLGHAVFELRRKHAG
jgi:molybdenum cofactor biosynthesis protein B